MSNPITIPATNSSIVLVPQSYVQSLIDENQRLKSEIVTLKGNNERLHQENDHQTTIITELREENERLKKEIKELKRKDKKLEKELDKLKSKFSLLESVEKLHECDAFANRNFQKEYRKEFSLNKYSKDVPTIGDFINDPPDEKETPKEYAFWLKFNNAYPGSNSPAFSRIYRRINENRMSYAHLDVSDISMTEFINSVQIVFPEEYKSNRKLYHDYGEWLFSFPE